MKDLLQPCRHQSPSNVFKITHIRLRYAWLADNYVQLDQLGFGALNWIASPAVLPDSAIVLILTAINWRTTTDNLACRVCFGSLLNWVIQEWDWSLIYLYQLKS